MDLDCKDGTCPIDGNKGKQTIRSGKSCLPCSGYKRYSTSNGFGKDSSSSGRLPRDEKKTSIGTGSGTIRKDATTPSLPAPRGDVIVPERATGPTGTTVGANSNPKRDVIRVGEGKGVVTGAATDGGASRPVSMPTANISGGTADAIGGTPARSGRASKGAIVTPAITDAVTTSSVIRTAAPTIPVVRMPSSSSITGLNIPKGVGREISINLPPSVSAKQPSPRGDVVTPKQAAPFVLAPIAPLATQQPRPDYCDATGMNELIACQRGSDGTFPAVSSACAQSFRDLLARGLSVAEIISGNELCSDEFRRLLAGATPVLIEPPKQGAPVAAAKGMPLAVAAPTMIVAPGGAPTAVNPVQCMAMFLALPSAAQASIVGAYPCPMARSLAPEIARGSRAAAADFVQWFGSAFRPESAEVSRFCAMTLSARGVAAAGAPGGKSMVLRGPREFAPPPSVPVSKGGYEGTEEVDSAQIGALGYPITIFGMPYFGRVFSVRADNELNELSGSWVDPKTQTTWRVTVPAGPSAGFILRPDGMYTTFELNVSPSGAAIVNLANARWFPVDKFMNDLFYRASRGIAPSGAPGGKSMVLRGPREFAPPPSVPVSKGGYEGTEEVDSAQIGALGYPITIFGMPYYGRVLVDGREVGGQWIGPQAWQVRAPVGQHRVVVTHPNGVSATFDINVSPNGAAVINTIGRFDPNRVQYTFPPTEFVERSVKPLTSPGSTGTAVYNAKAAGAPGGKSMVLAGPSGRSPFAQAGSSPAMVPASNRIMQVNAVRSPSSVAPGVASQGAGPSVAQCLQTLRAIASRDPRAIVAAFHQSGLDAIVPSRPGSGDAAADVLALIDDCAARRQQYPRQFDAFCRIAAALSGVKPGGDPDPDMTFSGDEAAEADRLAAKGASLADAPSSEPKRGHQQPGSSGPSASQIIGGIGSIATTGIGVLNSYLDRESAQHIEALRQNASSANEVTRQNALIEIARIQAASAERIAALGPNPSQQAIADVLNRTTNPSTSNQPPAQGMSTGTTVALAAGGVAIVGGIAYLALSKKGR